MSMRDSTTAAEGVPGGPYVHGPRPRHRQPPRLQSVRRPCAVHGPREIRELLPGGGGARECARGRAVGTARLGGGIPIPFPRHRSAGGGAALGGPTRLLSAPGIKPGGRLFWLWLPSCYPVARPPAAAPPLQRYVRPGPFGPRALLRPPRVAAPDPPRT